MNNERHHGHTCEKLNNSLWHLYGIWKTKVDWSEKWLQTSVFIYPHLSVTAFMCSLQKRSHLISKRNFRNFLTVQIWMLSWLKLETKIKRKKKRFWFVGYPLTLILVGWRTFSVKSSAPLIIVVSSWESSPPFPA